MQFREKELYHIYNRGNNRQATFFCHDNYLYFLQKVRKHILPHCEILNYCLMPNHFHFLLYADKRSIQTKRIGTSDRNVLSEGFRNLLSSYAQAINKQNGSKGSLFEQNTNCISLHEGSCHYGPICFHYVHQNPLKAKLVTKMEDWQYSSFKDFMGIRNGTLCNKRLAFELLDLTPQKFYEDSYKVINNNDLLNKIFGASKE
jgi:putative transposase